MSDVLKTIKIGKKTYDILLAKRKKYGYIDYRDETMTSYLRNPTPRQREIMIMNIIRKNSGKDIKVKDFSIMFAVSDRTVQAHLKSLENKGLIKREKSQVKDRGHRGSTLIYIGGDYPIGQRNYTYEEMLHPDNPLKIRDFDWEEFKFIPHVYQFGDNKKTVMEYKNFISKYDLD